MMKDEGLKCEQVCLSWNNSVLTTMKSCRHFVVDLWNGQELIVLVAKTSNIQHNRETTRTILQNANTLFDKHTTTLR